MKLTILFGTQSGMAQRLADTVVRLALHHGADEVRCLPMDEVPVENWTQYSPMIVFMSNASQGEAPDTARMSWLALRNPDTPSLHGLQYAIFGLGDSIYPKYNYMAKMMHNRMKQLGGEALVNRGLGDESDAYGHEENLVPWLTELFDVLGLTKRRRESEADSSPVAGDAQGTPTLSDASSATKPKGKDLLALGSVVRKYAIHVVSDSASGDDGNFVEDVYTSIPRAHGSPTDPQVFTTSVVSNARLTAPDHSQRVHHIELTRPAQVDYQPGDALGVYCPNKPESIDSFLQQLKQCSSGTCGGDTRILVQPCTTDGLSEQGHQPFFGKTMTLRTFVKYYVDLEAPVSRNFLWMLSRYTQAGSEEEERLTEFASLKFINDYLTYAYREKRNIVEVLFDFPTIRPPLDVVLSYAEPMRARLFSLSSSPLLDKEALALTVAELEWTTPYNRHRTGLCSGFLCDVPQGAELQAFLWAGTLFLPQPPEAPLVLIATGTGVAPLRSIIRQYKGICDASGDRSASVYLFFGCRYEKKDYLYANEWAELAACSEGREGEAKGLRVRVIPAFSRDTDKKMYVQHKLGQHAREVGKLVHDEKASVFVCGNAKQMPKDVENVLKQITTQVCGGGDDDEGADLWRQVCREGRYQVDSWSS